MTSILNAYYSDETVEATLAAGLHRDFVGGLWEELGKLQLYLLVSAGLQPHHTLIDIGCGSLRGGLHIVRLLEAGGYFGLDLRQELLDVGYAEEIEKAGLAERLPRSNLIADAEFDVARFGRTFDYALAFSLFTHLPLNHVRLCLERLAPALRPGGKFIATFFERPETALSGEAQQHPPGPIISYGARDPYHYSKSDIEYACKYLPWRAHFMPDIAHPRGQMGVMFERLED